METYMTIEEVAAAIKLSIQTIRRYVMNREIPFHKIKKVIRFKPSEIEKWIESGGVYAPADDDEEEPGELFAGMEADSGNEEPAAEAVETETAGDELV